MNRYNKAPIITSKEDPKQRYVNIKYPLILPSSSDIYVYVGQGDRYDTLASNYYSDSSLWWIITLSNPNQPSDSLYPKIGAQLRIPSRNRVPSIIASYELLNGF